jgi:NCS1 family nucleobase:cation symporter-1
MEAIEREMMRTVGSTELEPAAIALSLHCNADLAPTLVSERRWGLKDIAALWISMSACIPTYMLASSLIAEGMNWWQAVVTIFLGNTIVLLPMVLNAHAGTKYGIPFPIYCRPSFGIIGANVPALLRAFVACGWFGIQCWIGGWAIYKILGIYVPEWERLPSIGSLDINGAQLVCFLAFWAINMVVIYLGIDSIRFLLNIKAPILLALGLALMGWAYVKANGFGPMLEQRSQFDAGGPKAGQFWVFFFPALTGMIGFWATLSLNIPDFTRYARSQREQVLGQALGLPTTMALYSFIGVAVTSATITIYGESIWDPVVLLSRFRNPFVLSVAMVSLCLATLATNIAANVVSPANDFSHLWPRRISFRTGGLITGILGILIQPWKLIADPSGYIFKWLVAYSSLLGAVGGVLIADYYVIRRTRLDVAGLYQGRGPYWYSRGVNPRALLALAAGIAPCVPGFLGTVGVLDVAPLWISMYHYAWFMSFALSGMFYLILMDLLPPRRAVASARSHQPGAPASEGNDIVGGNIARLIQGVGQAEEFSAQLISAQWPPSSA